MKMNSTHGHRIPRVMLRSGWLRFAWLSFSLLLSIQFAGSIRRGIAEIATATEQERVAELIQNALGPYRIESTLTNGTTIDPLATYTHIEASFREASRLMPNRLDLRFGIASALVGQALQTNSPFDVKMKGALQVYQEIHGMDTNGFQAALLYAAYARAIGDTNASDSAMAALMKVHRERTHAYQERFRRIEELQRMIPNMDPEKVTRTAGTNAIVILGAGLETNGTMKAKLVDRLQQGLLLAKLYPETPIVVTGGNQKGGITEAYAMSLWLLNAGVRTNRLHLEDRATDTLGNSIRSCAILRKLGVTHATLVTSQSHIRRALADFEEATRARDLKISFSHLASTDVPELDEARERVTIYRDMLRTSGIWTFPGIQR